MGLVFYPLSCPHSSCLSHRNDTWRQHYYLLPKRLKAAAQGWDRYISLSLFQLFAIAWTIVGQAPLSMGFSRQEYWSGLPFPALGDLPDSGIEPTSLISPALAGSFFTTRTTWEAHKLPTKLPPNSGQGYRSFSQESPSAHGASNLTLAKIHLVSSITPTLQSERICLSIHTHS